jgi:nucleotide-binding universal stress UspA family protein
MILFTCTIASFVAQKGAKNIALLDSSDSAMEDEDQLEKIIIPISNVETTDELVNLGVTIKSKKNRDGLFALSIVDNSLVDGAADKNAKKILRKAAVTAASTDNIMHELLRYDLSIVNGITSVIRENRITDLILGLHVKKGISDTFLGHLTEGILSKCNTTTLIYKPAQPFNTIKRHIIIVPENAEKELGFPFWLLKIWNIARNSGARLLFYANKETIKIISAIKSKHPIEGDFVEFSEWDDFLILARDIQQDDNLIIILSRKDKPSYHENMTRIPSYLNKYFKETSYILVYPMQVGVTDSLQIDLTNPSLLEPLEKIDEIGKTIAKIFKRR